MKTIPASTVAQALQDEELMPAELAAKKNGISTASISRYKDKLEKGEIPHIEKLMQPEGAREKLNTGIITAVEYLTSASRSTNIDTPEMIDAITKALSKMAEVRVMMDMFDL